MNSRVDLKYCCTLAVSELPTTPAMPVHPFLAGSSLCFRKDNPGPVTSSWVTGWCSWSLKITTCRTKPGMLAFTHCTFSARATPSFGSLLRCVLPIPRQAELGLQPHTLGTLQHLPRVLLIMHRCHGDLGLFFVFAFLGLSSCFSFLWGCVTDIEETLIFWVLAPFCFSPLKQTTLFYHCPG